MRRPFVVCILALAALLCGCADDPGSFSIMFQWQQEPADSVYVWVRVEEREIPLEPGLVLASEGPVLCEPGESCSMDVDSVPFGSNRVVVVEVRASADAGGAVVYYGISEPFDLKAGEDVVAEVPVYLKAAGTG